MVCIFGTSLKWMHLTCIQMCQKQDSCVIEPFAVNHPIEKGCCLIFSKHSSHWLHPHPDSAQNNCWVDDHDSSWVWVCAAVSLLINICIMLYHGAMQFSSSCELDCMRGKTVSWTSRKVFRTKTLCSEPAQLRPQEQMLKELLHAYPGQGKTVWTLALHKGLGLSLRAQF